MSVPVRVCKSMFRFAIPTFARCCSGHEAFGVPASFPMVDRRENAECIPYQLLLIPGVSLETALIITT